MLAHIGVQLKDKVVKGLLEVIIWIWSIVQYSQAPGMLEHKC